MGYFNVASTVKRVFQGFRALRCNDDGILQVNTYPDQPLDAYTRYRTGNILNLYLHLTEAEPSILSTQTIGSYVINVSPTTNIDANDAITIREAGRSYQSIVKSKTVDTVTVASPLDYAFTTAAGVRAGSWNLNVNGSVTPVEFEILAVPGATMFISSISLNMVDGSPMDSSLFGSIASLTNGLVLRHEGVITKNIALITNNSGFSEQGFITTYDDKPPSGVYGVRHVLSFPYYYNVVRRVEDSPTDRFVVMVQDNLTALNLVAVNIGGHIEID